MTVQPSERYTTRAKNASAADKNRATSFSNKKAVLPLTILTDKLRVAQGLGRNEALCTTDKGQNADGWTTIHEAPRKIEEGLRKHLVLSHGSALHPCVARVEQSYIARDSFLGWLAKILGRIHAEVKFRGWSDVVSRVQRQRRALLGKLVVFQREPRRKRAAHAKFSRTHEDGQVLVVLEVRVPHRTTGERACGAVSRSRARPERSTPEVQGWQKPKRRTLAGGANLACGGPGGRGPGGCDGSWMGLVWLLSWSAMGLAWTNLKRDTSLTCHSRARTCAILLDLFGR